MMEFKFVVWDKDKIIFMVNRMIFVFIVDEMIIERNKKYIKFRVLLKCFEVKLVIVVFNKKFND